MSRKNFSALALLLLAVLVVALFTPPPEGPTQPAEAAKSCRSCHKSYDPLTINVAAPGVVGVNLTDSLLVELGVPWKHEARDVTVTLELAADGPLALAEGEPTQKTISSIAKRQSASLSWQLLGVKPGTATVGFTIDSTSHYNHKDSKKPDNQAEHFSGEVSVEVAKLEVGLSPSLLVADPAFNSNQSLYLTNALNSGDITGVNLTPDTALAPYFTLTGLPPAIAPSAQGLLNFSLAAGHPSGTLTVTYTLPDATAGNATVEILTPVGLTQGSANSGSGYYLTVGALYGWLAVVGMVAAMAQGFTKRWLDKRYMADFKDARKEKADWTREEPGERQGYWWWLHTLLLFVLVVFVYVHVLGAFRGGFPVAYDAATVLGIVAMVALLVVGLSGLWPKKMKKYFGTKRWKKVHAALSALALIFGLVHGFLLRYVFFV